MSEVTPGTFRVMFTAFYQMGSELGEVWQDDGNTPPETQNVGHDTTYVTAHGLLVELPADPREADIIAAKIRAFVTTNKETA